MHVCLVRDPWSIFDDRNCQGHTLLLQSEDNFQNYLLIIFRWCIKHQNFSFNSTHRKILFFLLERISQIQRFCGKDSKNYPALKQKSVLFWKFGPPQAFKCDILWPRERKRVPITKVCSMDLWLSIPFSIYTAHISVCKGIDNNENDWNLIKFYEIFLQTICMFDYLRAHVHCGHMCGCPQCVWLYYLECCNDQTIWLYTIYVLRTYEYSISNIVS